MTDPEAEIRALLGRKLKPGLVDEVMDRPAPVFGGLSINEMIAAGYGAVALGMIELSFGWTEPA